MKEKQQDALVVFTDFIYASVFALMIQQAFTDALKVPLSMDDALRLFLLATFFYFLAWDWILGRMLTVQNPYECYRCFFCELAIASFAYGMVHAAIQARLSSLVFLAAVFAIGALWAMLSKRARVDSESTKEFDLITYSHGFAAACFLLIWAYVPGGSMESSVAIIVGILLWVFIVFYELLVERESNTGLEAGPGLAFIPSSWLAKSRYALSLVRK